MIEKFNQWLTKQGIDSGHDKILHLIVGFLIAFIFGISAYFIGLDYPQQYGVYAGVLAGVYKEAWDYFDYGTFDTYDMLATFVGTFCGGLLVVILV